MRTLFFVFFLFANLFGMDQALFDAVNNGDIGKTRELIKEGANINIQNQKKQSPIMLATYKNDIEMVELLFKHGADVNIQDIYKNTPFLYAGASGQIEIVKIVHTRSDTKLLNRFGGNALIPASEKGHVEVVEFLLQNTDIDVNHINNLGWTALLEVVILGQDCIRYGQIAKMLIDHGASISIKDHKGKDALYYAKKKNMSHILKVLEER